MKETRVRGKRYMRRISVGGPLAKVHLIDSVNNKIRVKLYNDVQGYITDIHSIGELTLPKPASITHVGQLVRIFAKSI